MAGSRTIAIIGGINRDEVCLHDGRLRRGYGGILYNIASLRKFAPQDTILMPVAYLGRNARTPVGRWFDSHENIDRSGIVPRPCAGNLCKLRYTNACDRSEVLLHPVPALEYHHLRPALGADVALINFISGRDVRLSALEKFRDAFEGTIYLDIHSYLLGRRCDGSRFPRRPLNWLRVLATADILQMNASEFWTLSGCDPDQQEVVRWVSDTLKPMRCACVLVTLGGRGVLCLTRRKTRWNTTQIAALKRPRSIDPTGAGDTFAGAWIAAWLRHRNPLEATRYATRRAARPVIPMV